MALSSTSKIADLLENREVDILREWLIELQQSGLRRDDLMRSTELNQQCQDFLRLFRSAAQHENFSDIQAPEWGSMRQLLTDISSDRAQQGFTPSEVATFILSFKKPVFECLKRDLAQQSDLLIESIWVVTSVLDQLGLWTTEVFQKAREHVILRQQQELLELSTPV